MELLFSSTVRLHDSLAVQPVVIQDHAQEQHCHATQGVVDGQGHVPQSVQRAEPKLRLLWPLPCLYPVPLLTLLLGTSRHVFAPVRLDSR